jgi:hypothetical protein
MNIKYGLLSAVLCAAFSIGCENRNSENVSPNRNNFAANQNTANNAVAGKARAAVDENSNVKANIETETNADQVDFTGTAGIIDKRSSVKSAAVLTEVRAARHENYDRVVFEFEGAEMPSYHLEYIDKPVRACGSGEVVPLTGDGWLEIRFEPAAAHTADGRATVANREQSPNLQIIKEMKATCDFEAQVEWVLGVASPNHYRVLELKKPTRLAIDIKH